MEKIPSWVLSVSLLLLISSANSEEDEVKQSLIAFLEKLAPSNAQIAREFGWNPSSDPCLNRWKGIACNNQMTSVRKVVIEGLPLGGLIDPRLLCKPPRLAVVSLQDNGLQGNLPSEISNCTQLTHLLVNGNRLIGSVPSSLAGLKNLKRLDISENGFSGGLSPDLAKVSGLITFLAQNNQLNGSIPQFDFANLQQFNVSYNLFSGAVPEGGDKFGPTSVLGNAGLCGEPSPMACPRAPSPTPEKKSKRTKIIIPSVLFSIVGLFLVLFITYLIAKTKNTGNKKEKETSTSSGNKTASRSEYSIATSGENAAAMSASLINLNSLVAKELKLDQLLKAPAELIGRGRFGSLYKVILSDGTALAVKRIKDWTVSAQEFHRRMEQIDRVKHPRVLSAIAFYCSEQEKLVVYEYKENGSLFKLLHGNLEGSTFDWSSRLSVAAEIADGLSYMHEDLSELGIGHGTLKSSNIIMDNNMQPCISEYGLLAIPKQNFPPSNSSSNGRKSVNPINDSAIKADIYNFGVILLELLTGKLVENNGFDLAQWVNSVVREEWTAEVFDKALTSEGVNEGGMVRLLQVALKCIDHSADARPTMTQVAAMIQSIREEEDSSIASSSM